MDARRSPQWPSIAAPAVAGLLARLALIAWTNPLTLSLSEERSWDLSATRMAGTAFVPPFYPLFLAGVRALFGDSVLYARLFGACLSTVSIVLVYRLAERHLGPGAGRVPAWIAALLPGPVYFDGRLRSESLLIVLLLGFASLWSLPGQDDARTMLSAGVLAGAVALLRPEFLLLPPVLVAIAARQGPRQRALRKGLLLLPGLLLLVGGWTMRSHRVAGSWAPVSTNGGYNFWKSFDPSTDGSQVPLGEPPVFAGGSEGERDAAAYREGWSDLAAHPVRGLLLAPAKLAHLFGPERDFLSDVKQAHFPRRSRVADLAFALLQNVAWAGLLALGLDAVLGPSRSPVKQVVQAVLLTLVMVHLVFFGDDRFHVPLLPFLCVALPEAWDGSVRTAAARRALALVLAGEGLAWILILARDIGPVSDLLRG